MNSMEAIRESKAIRWMVLLMAGIILNLSIDPPDREAPGVAEDPTINDIESIVELVAEQLLGIENFLPENDESDDSGFAKKALDHRCTPILALLDMPHDRQVMVITYPFAEQFTVQYEPEPRVPPPWA